MNQPLSGPMTVSIKGTVHAAIAHNWKAEQLKECFNDVPLDICQLLLNGKMVIGSEYPNGSFDIVPV